MTARVESPASLAALLGVDDAKKLARRLKAYDGRRSPFAALQTVHFARLQMMPIQEGCVPAARDPAAMLVAREHGTAHGRRDRLLRATDNRRAGIVRMALATHVGRRRVESEVSVVRRARPVADSDLFKLLAITARHCYQLRTQRDDLPPTDLSAAPATPAAT